MKASMGYLFRLEIKIDLKCFYVESMSKRLYFTTAIDSVKVGDFGQRLNQWRPIKKNRIE